MLDLQGLVLAHAALSLQFRILLPQRLLILLVFLQLLVSDLQIVLQFLDDLLQLRNRFVLGYLFLQALHVHFDLLCAFCELQRGEGFVDGLF